MPEVVNGELGIGLRLPDDWLVQTPSKPKNQARRSRSQKSSFGYLSPGKSRLIAHAAKVRKWSGHLEVSLTLYALAGQWRDPRISYLCENEADRAWTKTEGSCRINGLEFLYVDRKSPHRNSKHPHEVVTVRFAFCRIRPRLWLYARLWGSNRDWFRKAAGALETLRRISKTDVAHQKPDTSKRSSPEARRRVQARQPNHGSTRGDRKITATKHVYAIGQSVESRRPIIRWNLRENLVDWNTYGPIIRGEAPKTRWVPLRLVVRARGAENWHWYSSAGHLGIVSQRFVDLVGAFAKGSIDFLPCYVNDAPYFYMRPVSRKEWLDVKHCKKDPMDEDWIRKFAFHKDRIQNPSLFLTPQSTFVFATDGAVSVLMENKMKGIRIMDAETDSF